MIAKFDDFAINLDLGLDLFLNLDDKVELDGGFRISIPDGETISLNITVDYISDEYNSIISGM
jgi:hypothetical protein